jgi:hypothetical protein
MSEYLKPNVIINRVNRGIAIYVNGELEVKCSKCSEFFPHTTQFFYGAGKRGLESSCRACCIEHRENREESKGNKKFNHLFN